MASDRVYGFSRETADKLLGLVGPDGPPRTRRTYGPVPSIDVFWVTVDSLTLDDGRYPGTRHNYDALTDTFTDAEDIWVVTANGEAPVIDSHYLGTRQGVANGREVWQIAGKGPPWKSTGLSTSFSYTASPNEIIDVAVPEYLADTAEILLPASVPVGSQVIVRLTSWYTTGDRYGGIKIYYVSDPHSGTPSFIWFFATNDSTVAGGAGPVRPALTFTYTGVEWHVTAMNGVVYDAWNSWYTRTPAVESGTVSGLVFKRGFYTGGALAIDGGTF